MTSGKNYWFIFYSSDGMAAAFGSLNRRRETDEKIQALQCQKFWARIVLF
jgi:hypothetical protein